MRENNRAILEFYTDAGDIVRISIPRARADKTTEEAYASMQALLDTNAIATVKGLPNTIRGAEIVQTRYVTLV